MELKLRILTLNCWGIPFISKDRKPRMVAIAELLSTDCYDVVCLQEVWSDSDYNLIRDRVKSVLPYSHYFYSGVIGSGVCIISKHPFEEVFFHQWPVNGYVHKLQHADWFGGKGVGLCRLRIDDFNINIYSAHLHAEYNRKSDEYLAHRVLQAFDTAQFIRLTSAHADVVVLAGDLNTEPGDIAYRVLMGATGLTDSYTKLDEITSEKYYSTNESYTNSYTDKKLIDEKFQGKRIDYIMYRISGSHQVQQHSYEHPLPNRVSGCKYSYSDHEAVTVTLDVRPGNQVASPQEADSSFETTLTESMQICDDAMIRVKYQRRLYSFCTMFLLFILLLDAQFNYEAIRIIIIFVTGTFCFTLIMAALWKNIEYNALLAGKLTMDINLKYLLNSEKHKKKD